MDHVLAVPCNTYIALTIQENQSSCTMCFCSQNGNCFLSSLACMSSVADKICRSFGNKQAYKVLSFSSTRDRGVLVSIEAATSKWRITYTPWTFICDATCRGSGSQDTKLVKCNCSYCTMFLFIYSLLTHMPVFFAGCYCPHDMSVVSWLFMLYCTGFEPIIVLALCQQILTFAKRHTLL